MLSRIKNTIKTIKAWDRETLEVVRYTMFILIVGDIFGIYWYLGLKQLGIALLMVFVVILTFILILERGKEVKKMPEEKTEEKPKEEEKKEEKKPEEEVKKDYEDDELRLEIPDSEEYNKRLGEAIGG